MLKSDKENISDTDFYTNLYNNQFKHIKISTLTILIIYIIFLVSEIVFVKDKSLISITLKMVIIALTIGFYIHLNLKKTYFLANAQNITFIYSILISVLVLVVYYVRYLLTGSIVENLLILMFSLFWTTLFLPQNRIRRVFFSFGIFVFYLIGYFIIEILLPETKSRLLTESVFFLLEFLFLTILASDLIIKTSYGTFYEKQKQHDYIEQIEIQSDLIMLQNDEYIQVIGEFQKGEQKLKSIFNNAIISLASTNLEGQILYANDLFLSMLGYEPDKNLDKNLIEYISNTSDKEQIFNKHFVPLLKNEIKSTVFEKEIVRKDLSTIWCRVSLSLIYHILKPEGILCALVDISDIKVSEAKLKRAHHELMKSNHEVIMTNLELELQQTEILRQKEELQKKNEDITSSLNYASKIQQAILPQYQVINKSIPDLFIFHKPKDIVSGDFYFFAKIRTSTGLKNTSVKLVLAVADCTGHGVPGAFMTIIGSIILEDLINVRKVVNPAVLLTELDIKLSNIISNHYYKDQLADGMDISIAVIDPDEKSVTFSGAKMPFLFFQRSKEMFVKGSKSSIGGKFYDNERLIKHFENAKIFYEPDDVIYLYSDGFQDQFGGENDRKYGSREFRKFLKSIHKQNFTQQFQQIGTEFKQWINPSMYQIDDVLVIGFKPGSIVFTETEAYPYHWPDKTVLIAEDQELSYLALSKLLKKTGINIIWVRTGLDAIKYAVNPLIDIILMDIDMPVMNGIDATAAIRRKNTALPIIVQTALTVYEKKSEAFKAGCNDYISKPVNETELLATLAKYI